MYVVVVFSLWATVALGDRRYYPYGRSRQQDDKPDNYESANLEIDKLNNFRNPFEKKPQDFDVKFEQFIIIDGTVNNSALPQDSFRSFGGSWPEWKQQRCGVMEKSPQRKCFQFWRRKPVSCPYCEWHKMCARPFFEKVQFCINYFDWQVSEQCSDSCFRQNYRNQQRSRPSFADLMENENMIDEDY